MSLTGEPLSFAQGSTEHKESIVHQESKTGQAGHTAWVVGDATVG